MYGQENFEGLNPGDSAFAGNLLSLPDGSAANREAFLVNNDNVDMRGNHLDGDSAGEEAWSRFDSQTSDYSIDTLYLQGVFDNHVTNFNPSIKSPGSALYSQGYSGVGGLGWSFEPNGGAHAGREDFDTTQPTVITYKLDLDSGLLDTYSFTAWQPSTNTSWSHGPLRTTFPVSARSRGASSTTGEPGRTWMRMTSSSLRMRTPSSSSRRRSRC